MEVLIKNGVLLLMDSSKRPEFEIHKDPKYFREAILFTSQKSGFLPNLVEKDYYCSLILNHLFKVKETKLVFKGGTCLSKVYVSFYRMSEDLDFVIPVNSNIPRNIRRELIEPIKDQFSDIIDDYNCFQIQDEFTGFNESRQYLGILNYNSVLDSENKPGIIKIEVALREELLMDAVLQDTSTLLIDPFRETDIIVKFKTQCIAIEEVYSEKLRAALTRRDPAIRDYYDIFYAIKNHELNFLNDFFLSLTKAKLSIPNNEPVMLNTQRKQQLVNQLETELKPVLREQDLADFDFDLVYDLVEKVSQMIVNL